MTEAGMYGDLVARLRDFAEHLLPASDLYAEEIGTLDEAATAIETLEAQVAKLEEALKPFAVLANDYMTDTANIEDDLIMAGRMTRRGEEDSPPRVTFGDYRRAHLAFKLAGGFARLALKDTP